jgi:hypothetical protein
MHHEREFEQSNIDGKNSTYQRHGERHASIVEVLLQLDHARLHLILHRISISQHTNDGKKIIIIVAVGDEKPIREV